MKGCRQIRGMLAASLYEALPENEADMLERHLAVCTACRAEQAALRQLAEDIPAEPAVFQGDLLPALREQRRQATRPRVRLAWLAPASVFAVAALALVVFLPGLHQPSGNTEITGQDTPSPLARTLDHAAALETDGDLTAARHAIETALASAPEDTHAGEAWLALARVQYGLGHYEEALAAYETTRADHPEAWRTSTPGAKLRFDLLADTRDEGFAPLVTLERARRKGAGAFDELEHIVARRPESMVANEALATMCAAVRASAVEGSTVEGSAVALLEEVRERCSDPTALARVDLEMGHAYWRDLDDPVRAREHFTLAAEAGNEALAGLAHQALAALEKPAR